MSSSHNITGCDPESGDRGPSMTSNADSNNLADPLGSPLALLQTLDDDLDMFMELESENQLDLNGLVSPNQYGSWDDARLEPYVQGMVTTTQMSFSEMHLPNDTYMMDNEALQSTIGQDETLPNTSLNPASFQSASTNGTFLDSMMAEQPLNIGHELWEVNQTRRPFQITHDPQSECGTSVPGQDNFHTNVFTEFGSDKYNNSIPYAEDDGPSAGPSVIPHQDLPHPVSESALGSLEGTDFNLPSATSLHTPGFDQTTYYDVSDIINLDLPLGEPGPPVMSQTRPGEGSAMPFETIQNFYPGHNSPTCSGPVQTEHIFHGENVNNDIGSSSTIKLVPKARLLTNQKAPLLHPARRGGRRGPLKPEQLAHQKKVKSVGACIRCRRSKVKCGGGLPCDACLASLKPRIWNKPCTKAHFLDIIEIGSYFPYVTLHQLSTIRTDGHYSIASQLHLMFHLAAEISHLEFTSFLDGASCMAPWALGFIALFEMDFKIVDNKYLHFVHPTASKATKILIQMSDQFPAENVDFFPFGFHDKDAFHRAGYLMTLCATPTYTFHEDLDKIHVPGRSAEEKQSIFKEACHSLIWFACRIQEICLCRYLQRVSNDLDSCSADEKKTYILSMMQFLFLKPPIDEGMIKNLGIDPNDPEIVVAAAELRDRQERLQMAFWVYGSIAIGQLPAWSYWDTVRDAWPIVYNDALPRKFEADLTTFQEHVLTTVREKTRPLRRLCEVGFAVLDMNPTFKSAIESDKPPLPGITARYIQDKLCSGEMEDELTNMDEFCSDGLLTADTEEKRKAVAIRLFFFLNSTPWRNLYSDSKEANVRANSQFSMLLVLIRRRRLQIELNNFLESSTDEMELLTALSEIMSEEELSVSLSGICPGNHGGPSLHDELGSGNLGKFRGASRSGRRWKEMISLFGSEEAILLASCQLRDFSIPQMNISEIIDHGNEVAFESLKKTITTSCMWLQEIFTKLDGVLKMIMEIAEDSVNASVLAEIVGNRITSVFGQPAFLVQCLKDVVSAMPFTPVLRLLHVLDPNLDTADQSKVRYMIAFRSRIQMATIMTLSIEHSKGNFDSRNAISPLEEALRTATTKFLVEDCPSFVENNVDPNKAETMRIWLSQAIDSSIGALSLSLVFWALEAPTEAQRMFVNKRVTETLEKCKEAISRAFS